MNKTLALASQLGSSEILMPDGNEALSATKRRDSATPLVPASGVFSRIFDMLPKRPAAAAVAATQVQDASIEAVEEALKQMELHAVPPGDRVLQGHSFVEQQTALSSPTASNLGSPREEGGIDVSTLFSKPSPPLLQSQAPTRAKMPTPPAPPRRRQRRVFNMSSVCRSARLASARPMTQMQRAQKNLCRKLGLVQDELEPVETALQEFVAMFNGPLPADIIAALTEVLNLDNDDVNAADDALLKLVGEGLEDLAGEVPMAA
ncbi:hypothetical protein BS78_05G274900 [Paspalum vaginatum]|nr:hypothetical protein BS78_05G274900 [Paspalum vaginatum]